MKQRRPLRSSASAMLVAVLLVTGCARSISPAPSATQAPTPPAGDRPVIVTTDLGTSDIYALMILLRMPGIDVRAIGIDGTGEVHCLAGERNLGWLLTQLARSGIPYGCGPTDPSAHALRFPEGWRASADSAYGLPVGTAPGTPAGSAKEVLTRAIEAATTPPVIVAIGSWTTLAALFATRPDLVSRVAGIHAMAGVIDAPGNVEIDGRTTADPIEWNVAADPDAVASVLALDILITLVPLDATDDVPVPSDFGAELATDHAAAGADIAYELELRNPYRASSPGTQFWDELAVVTLTDPSLATWQTARVIVTLDAAPAGRLLRDDAGREITYAAAASRERSVTAILAGLRHGAPRPTPFGSAGELRVAFDGTTCRFEGDVPVIAGDIVARLRNDRSVEPTFPDWLIPIPGNLAAQPGAHGATLAGGSILGGRASKDSPNLKFNPAAPLVLASP